MTKPVSRLSFAVTSALAVSLLSWAGTALASPLSLNSAAAVAGASQAQVYRLPKSKDPAALSKSVRDKAKEMRDELRQDTQVQRDLSAGPPGSERSRAAAGQQAEVAAVEPLAAAEPPAQPAPAPGAPAPGAQPAAPGAHPIAPAAASAPADPNGPKLVFDNPAHDFGTLPDTAPVTTRFTFRNIGKQKLVINAINTGCGCTAAKMAKQEFEAGEAGEIEITYNPKPSGKQQRAINITSNDATNPNMQVTIAANVIPLLDARPSNIQFGQTSIGETRTVQLVIVSRDKNLKVTSVESNGPEVVAKIVPDGKPQVLVEQELPGVAVIDVTLADSAPVGRVMRQLTIKAQVAKSPNDPQAEQELKVFCFGQVQGEVNLNPQQIRVAPTAPQVEFEREVIVTRRGNLDFKILSAEVANSTLPGATATIEPWSSGDAKGFKVKLKGTTTATPGNFRGSIMLTTDLEREKSVEVQFSGITRAAPGADAASNPTPTSNAQTPAPAPK